jgi:hypothetical protein
VGGGGASAAAAFLFWPGTEPDRKEIEEAATSRLGLY